MNQLQEQSFSKHLQSELLDIERGFWERGNEAEYYRDNMVDSGLAVLEPGIMEKDQVMEMTTLAKPWKGVEMTDIRMMPLCADCVALIYSAEGKRPDNQEPYSARVNSTYLRRNERWQLALHQQTMIEPKGSAKESK